MDVKLLLTVTGVVNVASAISILFISLTVWVSDKKSSARKKNRRRRGEGGSNDHNVEFDRIKETWSYLPVVCIGLAVCDDEDGAASAVVVARAALQYAVYIETAALMSAMLPVQ